MPVIPAGILPWLKWGVFALLLLGAAALSGALVNSHWKDKWLERNATDLRAQVRAAQADADNYATWAEKFAAVVGKSAANQKLRDSTYEKTLADYRAGNKRLREQFTCYRDMSQNAASGRPTDGARGCGLSDADVEFLVQTGREGNRLRDKVNELQDIIRAMQARRN
ncbi:putative i-spanin [Pantoea phage Nafs113]|nr:putative i-spanin [Pantoea phage Nafs113]